MYVLAIEKGALLKSTVLAQTKVTEKKSESETKARAGITDLLGLQGKSADAMKQITDNATLSLDNVQRGAKRDPTAKLDEMVQYAYQYPTLAEGAEAQVGFKLAPYDRLPSASAAGVESVPYATLTAIDTLADKHDEAVTQRNNLRFAKSNPGVYTIDETVRLKELKETEDYLEQIAEAVDTCETEPIATCTAQIKTVGAVPTNSLKPPQ